MEALLNETDAEDRVYGNRIRPAFQTELPIISVRTASETVSEFAEAPKEYERVLTVEVEILAEADDSLDDSLDIIGQQVEFVLYQDNTLGEICRDVVLKGANIQLEKNGNNLLGALTLTYDVLYYTQPVIDPSTLEWLNRVHVEYDLVDGTSAENPEDLIDDLSGA